VPQFNESSALLFKTAVDSGICSPEELANLMGNATVGTRHFRNMHERFAYSSADNVIAVISSVDEVLRARGRGASGNPQQIAKAGPAFGVMWPRAAAEPGWVQVAHT
jgi:putative chitinase